MEERSFHPLDYLSVLRRRKRWFLIPFATCVVLGLVAMLVLPRLYESKASIAVAAPTLSPEILKGVSSLDPTERQRAIQQYLLSAVVLERVAREEQIDPAKSSEEMVNWLRRRVEVKVPVPIGGNPRAERGIESFDLYFRDSNPDRTRRVTDRLANVFVEENSRQTTQRAENTVEVLGQQLRASQERLNQFEEQLRVKKERFMGRLPDQVSANLQTANGLRGQLDSISREMSLESNQLLMLESQLEQMRQGGAGAAMTSSGAAAISTAQARINQLNQQLVSARALGYTDKHPEVISLESEIAQARADLASAKRDTGGGSVLQADPLYQQKVAERNALKGRIQSLRQAETSIRQQISAYQNRVEAAPMVEQELAGVTREHDSERQRYNDLKTKYDAALLQGDITRQQGGERFSVLYSASRPELASMDPLRMMLLAFGAGLVLGAVMLVGREFLDRSVHDARSLQSEFEIPVLGEIPTIHRAA
ncbi:MAG TPA: Wzz/FepE/Etk N-terminal domain-containing protein [Vicinamibacterales bacterium]|jgi:polysaccharide chain length determinant protein (PEP-CTERM system associated)|nr:Wzz/FepE/Etk N-terminal domain-containing protein [Vicinamibacterales bacterium]